MSLSRGLLKCVHGGSGSQIAHEDLCECRLIPPLLTVLWEMNGTRSQ